MNEWAWMDYLDERGGNPIAAWFRSIGHGAATKIETRMIMMRNLPKEQWGANWVEKLTSVEGVFEIKTEYMNTQYRPLCCYGPERGQITILVGACEVGGKFAPKSAPKDAEKRRKDIRSNSRRVIRHELP